MFTSEILNKTPPNCAQIWKSMRCYNIIFCSLWYDILLIDDIQGIIFNSNKSKWYMIVLPLKKILGNKFYSLRKNNLTTCHYWVKLLDSCFDFWCFNHTNTEILINLFFWFSNYMHIYAINNSWGESLVSRLALSRAKQRLKLLQPHMRYVPAYT